jgi:hypothetical protein
MSTDFTVETAQNEYLAEGEQVNQNGPDHEVRRHADLS